MQDDLLDLHERIAMLPDNVRQQLVSELSHAQHLRPIRDLTSKEQAFYDAVLGVCDRYVSYKLVLPRYGLAKFMEKSDEAYSFVDDTRRYLRPPQVKVLLDVAMKCLAADLRSRELPVTPTLLLNQMGRLTFAVDQCFPGYARAGILHRIVT